MSRYEAELRDAGEESDYDAMDLGESSMESKSSKKAKGVKKLRKLGSMKALTPSSKNSKGKKSKKREEDRKYHRFITKVFKTIHPDMQIHPNTVGVINTCIYDLLSDICEEAGRFCTRVNKKTLSSGDLQYAVKTMFPPEFDNNIFWIQTTTNTKSWQ